MALTMGGCLEYRKINWCIVRAPFNTNAWYNANQLILTVFFKVIITVYSYSILKEHLLKF